MYPWDSKNRNLLAEMTKDAIRIIKGNDPKALWVRLGAAARVKRRHGEGTQILAGAQRQGQEALVRYRLRRNAHLPRAR